MGYAYRAINEIDPHILKMNVLNLGYEGMFSGYNYVMELRKKIRLQHALDPVVLILPHPVTCIVKAAGLQNMARP